MKRKFPLIIQIAHWLMYLPFVIVYFIFEVAKAILTELDKVAIAIFVLMLILETVIMSRIFMNPFNFIRMAISNELWAMFMKDFFCVDSSTVAESIMLRIFLVSLYLFLFIGIPLLISSIVYFASEELNIKAKWDYIENEFGSIFLFLFKKTENDILQDKSSFYRRSIVSAVLNIVLIAFLLTLVGLISSGIITIETRNNKRTKVEADVKNSFGSTETESGNSQDYILVDASAANIRSGPGTDHVSIKLASKGERFRLTGRNESTKSGHVWYEIYLSEGTKETGWISESVFSK